MFLILGLIILLVAVIVAFVGVMGNLGSAHELTNDFSVFGYHVTSSTGALFLYGIAVGVVGLIGLYLLLAAVRRASRRGAATRRDTGVSRRESKVVDREREDLIQQRDAARAQAEEARADDRPVDVPASGHRRAKWFGRTTHR
ncbi:hypothetical protein ACFXEL_29920 [Streptomyces sp. NPDC059382]|uniref:hypothetical protein n=1 Tax=Streptomyces sp. NPDC059382 TaxID=3346816 RepID=UPI003680D46C